MRLRTLVSQREGGSAACITRESENFCKAAGYVRAKNLLISTNDESGNALTGDALTQKKALADKLEAELKGITDKTALEKR